LNGPLSGTARTHQVGHVNQEMRELTTDQAAGLLGVSSDALRGWEHRFTYFCTTPSADGERIYDYWHIAALPDALTRELSITSAITCNPNSAARAKSEL
jgi:MerR HTH family regulatory protein